MPCIKKKENQLKSDTPCYSFRVTKRQDYITQKAVDGIQRLFVAESGGFEPRKRF